MEKTCKNCKHWNRTYEVEGMINDWSDGKGNLIHGVISANHPFDMFMCYDSKDTERFKKIEGSDKPYGRCSLLESEHLKDDYQALLIPYARDIEGILTNENFGCIKFEAI